MVEQLKGQLVNVKSEEMTLLPNVAEDMRASVEQVSVSSAAWLLDDFHERITGKGTVHFMSTDPFCKSFIRRRKQVKVTAVFLFL